MTTFPLQNYRFFIVLNARYASTILLIVMKHLSSSFGTFTIFCTLPNFEKRSIKSLISNPKLNWEKGS